MKRALFAALAVAALSCGSVGTGTGTGGTSSGSGGTGGGPACLPGGAACTGGVPCCSGSCLPDYADGGSFCGTSDGTFFPPPPSGADAGGTAWPNDCLSNTDCPAGQTCLNHVCS